MTQAKITQYLPLDSNDLFAAGSQKLLLVVRDQNVIQRYDLATLQKDLTVPLPEVGQVDGLALGHASAGPALLMTRDGPRFLDLATLALADPKNGIPGGYWRPHPQYPLQVRASANGSTFAAWEPGLSPSGIRILTLEGDTAQARYVHNSAGALQPSFDGSLLFTGVGLYSAADLGPLPPNASAASSSLPTIPPISWGSAGRTGSTTVGTARRRSSFRCIRPATSGC